MAVSYEEIREQIRQQLDQLPAETRKKLLTDLMEEHPSVRLRHGQARDYSRERRWLREHGHEYRGQTLAISGDELVAHGIDPEEVYDRAKATGRRFLIHRVPAEGEIWGGGFW